MDGYLPLSMMTPGSANSSGFWTDRRDRELTVMGRLKAGIGIRQAQSSTDVIAGRLAAAYPAADQRVTVRVIPERMARPAPFVASFVPVIASLFLALAALVLMLAALNVANILLARDDSAAARDGHSRGFGAGRGRLIRQMLTESLLLGFLGAIRA
ncbi:MAG TPA: hypothetical protein VKV15_15205 [Bryobacteraceae bacterium]|nr:hypothetical protein [Bryobacteraceae bacterium]